MPLTFTGGMTATGGLSTLDAPALSLDFMSGTLDSRITFSRGTQATMIDSSGNLTYAPNNLVTQSEFINGVSDAPTRSGLLTATTFPFLPSNTGLAFGYDGTTSTWAYKSDVVALSATYVFSVYVEMTDGLAPNFGSTTNASNLNSFIIVIGGSGVSAPTYTVESVGGSVYRVSAVRTVTSIPANNTGVLKFNTNDNRTFKVSGYQLEQVTYKTTPSTYIATTTTAYYGPRFDYDPISLQLRGLLVEGQRTNLVRYSNQFDFTSVAWGRTRVLVSPNATSAPDGTDTADKLIADTSSSTTHILSQNVTITANTTYTYSIYAKAAEYSLVRLSLAQGGGNPAVVVDANLATSSVNVGTIGVNWTSTSASIIPVGNGWFRISVTGTNTSVTGGTVWVQLLNPGTIFTGDNNSGIFIWGAQLEVGSFATSYIPTVDSTVTRNADNMLMTGTNFSSWYNQNQGTFVISYLSPANPVQDIFGVNAGNFQNSIAAFYGSSTQLLFTRVSNVGQLTNNVISTLSQTSPVKLAIAYAANDYASCGNGGTVQTNSTSGSVPTVDRLTFANLNIQGNPFNGYYRSFEYYNTRIANSQLQGMSRV